MNPNMTSPLVTQEKAHDILGIDGLLFAATVGGNNYREGTFTSQTWKCSKVIDWHGREATITVELRFDDACCNGHNTFAMTAYVRYPRARDIDAGGCMHDTIVEHFPALASLVKWHLVSTDEPMHYVANAVYHAGNRDHRGLLKGEEKPVLGPDGIPTWLLELPEQKRAKQHEKPESVTLEWKLWTTTGEGKERDLDAARSCAVWPDATDEELTAPGLRERLEARLPALLAEFKAAMVDTCGFLWAPPEVIG